MLEKLYMDGVLMISERKGFQKVYDLTERVLPADVNTDFPSESEMVQYLIRAALKSQALATEKEIGYLRQPYVKRNLHSEIKLLLKKGELIEVQIEGLPQKYLSLADDFSKKINRPEIKKVRIISPFDNLAIQRQRLKNIFNFSYQIECYVPEQKRKYGYFTLPLLYENHFVGVIDLKAHRDLKKLEVISIFTIHQYQKNMDFMNYLKQAIDEFSNFNQCEEVIGFKKIKKYENK